MLISFTSHANCSYYSLLYLFTKLSGKITFFVPTCSVFFSSSLWTRLRCAIVKPNCPTLKRDPGCMTVIKSINTHAQQFISFWFWGSWGKWGNVVAKFWSWTKTITWPPSVFPAHYWRKMSIGSPLTSYLAANGQHLWSGLGGRSLTPASCWWW